MLRQYVAEDHQDWDRWLPHCAWTYCSSIHSSTNFTLNKVMLGLEVQMPLDLLLPHPEKDKDGEERSAKDYVVNLHRMIHQVFDRVIENLEKATTHQKRDYNGDWAFHLPAAVPQPLKMKSWEIFSICLQIVRKLNLNLQWWCQTTLSSCSQ